LGERSEIHAIGWLRVQPTRAGARTSQSGGAAGLPYFWATVFLMGNWL